MKYYLLGIDVESKDIGTYPQTTILPIEDYDVKSPNYMGNLTWGKFPDFVPDLRFALKKKGKFSDVIDPCLISADGFLINEKVRKVFEQFNLVSHQYYEATVWNTKTNETRPYFWLHLVNDTYEGIDFQKSSFVTFDSNYKKLEDVPIHFKDEVDFLNFQKDIRLKHNGFSGGLEHLVLTEEFKAKQLDMFFFKGGLHTHIIVTEVLVEAIKTNQLTGFEWMNGYDELKSIQ